jgi:hypothetical protein
MSDPHLTLGFAALGFLIPYALFEIYDAWRFRHHPNESVKREVKSWGVVIFAWVCAVGLVAWF